MIEASTIDGRVMAKKVSLKIPDLPFQSMISLHLEENEKADSPF